MKIFAVINNYPDRAAKSPFKSGLDAPEWYEMPDSSVLRSGNPFFIPDFAENFTAFPSIIYRVGRLGKSISPRFASRYIDQVGMGCAVVATDLLASLRERQAPWARAVAFDRSLLLGNLQPVDTLLDLEEVKMTCSGTDIHYRPGDMSENIDSIISRLSAENTLKNGDLILGALSPEGIELIEDSRLTLYSHSNKTLLDITIK